MGTTAARMGQILNMLSDYLSRGFVLQKAKLPLTVHFYIKTTVLASHCSTERSLLNKIFGEKASAQTQKAATSYVPFTASHRWRHHFKKVSSTGQTRSKAKTAACLAKTSAVFSSFLLLARWGLQVKDGGPQPFNRCSLWSWKVKRMKEVCTLMINGRICW